MKVLGRSVLRTESIVILPVGIPSAGPLAAIQSGANWVNREYANGEIPGALPIPSPLYCYDDNNNNLVFKMQNKQITTVINTSWVGVEIA